MNQMINQNSTQTMQAAVLHDVGDLRVESVPAARAGATVVLIGMPPSDTVEININDLIVREITLRPIFRYNNTFPTGVQLLASGKVDVKPLISKTLTLPQVPEAFEYVVANRDSCVKAVVEIS